MVALSVIVNMYSVDIAGGFIKLSFVSAVCVIAGALFGPVYGFAIGFLGDLLAFMVMASGFAYSPFIGISNGMYSAIAGLVFMLFKNRGLFIKVLISTIIAYFICTLFISSLSIYILFGTRYTFWVFILRRIIFQTPVSIVNAVVIYLLLKSMVSIKFFKVSVS